MSKPAVQMSVEEVCDEWLAMLKLDNRAPKFIENSVDGAVLAQPKESALSELGVSSPLEQARIIGGAKKLLGQTEEKKAGRSKGKKKEHSHERKHAAIDQKEQKAAPSRAPFPLLKLSDTLLRCIVRFLSVKDHLRLCTVNKALRIVAQHKASWEVIEIDCVSLFDANTIADKWGILPYAQRVDRYGCLASLAHARPRTLRLLYNANPGPSATSMNALAEMLPTVEEIDIAAAVFVRIPLSVPSLSLRRARVYCGELRERLIFDGSHPFGALVQRLKQSASLSEIELTCFDPADVIHLPQWSEFAKLPVSSINWFSHSPHTPQMFAINALAGLPLTKLDGTLLWMDDACVVCMAKLFPKLAHLDTNYQPNSGQEKPLTDVALTSLGSLPLTHLNIGGTAFTSAGLVALSRCPLRHLVLHFGHRVKQITSTEEAETKQFFTNLSHLQHLTLRVTWGYCSENVFRCAAQSLQYLPSISTLQSFKWGPSDAYGEDPHTADALMSAVLNMHCLRDLSVDCVVSAQSFEAMAHTHTQLQKLDCKFTHFIADKHKHEHEKQNQLEQILDVLVSPGAFPRLSDVSLWLRMEYGQKLKGKVVGSNAVQRARRANMQRDKPIQVVCNYTRAGTFYTHILLHNTNERESATDTDRDTAKTDSEFGAADIDHDVVIDASSVAIGPGSGHHRDKTESASKRGRAKAKSKAKPKAKAKNQRDKH